MPKVIQAAEFFVVGGPVQPDRLCYVERSVDRLLLEVIRAKQLCCALGPRGMGKSSLVLRTARTLRRAGELAAVVNLAQIGARTDSDTAERWAFSIAHKVAHELNLHADLENWWREYTAIATEQRLVDFLWEIVLTNTTAPITIFVDEIDAALDLPFAQDLFGAISDCQRRRARERDFSRLNFVLLGTASRRQLAGNDRSSPFMEAAGIEPGEFSLEEAYRLALGFGGEQELSQALMDRVYAWTSGHPYLTQKVARSVVRKGGRLEDVERVVHEQLLAPGAAADEPLLNHIRSSLLRSSPPARRAAKLLRRLASGRKVLAPTDVSVLEELSSSGVVVLHSNRRLEYRNRILKELVGGRWLRGSRLGWRVVAAAATLALAAAGAAFWYTQYLPVADVATLTSDRADAPAIDEAYRRLRALPGFAERADQLFAAALVRRARATTTLAEAVAIDAQLRTLPGQETVADQELSSFWLRRARGAAHAEQRDAAALFALRATESPSPEQATAAAFFRELVSNDYPYLERSLRLGSAPAAWHMLFAENTVVALDGEHYILHMPFGATAGSGTLGPPPPRLTALQYGALTRELVVAGDGTAGEFELTLALQHPVGSDLLVTLAAPSGAEAVVAVPSSPGAAAETFVFPAARGSPLAMLADEGRAGTWRLTVVDRREDNAGVLAEWALAFEGESWRDTPTELLPIPEPTRTEAVAVTVTGALALAQPEVPGAVGAVAVWNLATQKLVGDFTVPTVPRHAALNSTGNRLLTATDKVVTLWNVADGLPVARLTTETEFVLPPVFSPDGGYVAIAERVADAQPLYSVLRAADASLVGSIEGLADARSWQLGPGARYVAVTGPAHVVRVVELRRGQLLKRLTHVRDVERLLPLADGALVLTVDTAGELLVWSLTDMGTPRHFGTTVAAASVSVAANGTRVAYDAADGVVVVDVASGTPAYHLRHAGVLPITTMQLAADGGQLVTGTAEALRLWSLPSIPGEVVRPPEAAAPTAVAIDRTADLVAVGLRSGQLQLLRTGELAEAGSTARLDYFGHRGPITAVAVAASRGLAATGGSDGIVRFWDLTSAAPTGIVMQPASEPIAILTLSADGLWVASAAGRTVRVAAVADGRVAHEIPSAAAVTALVFSADASAIAIGDGAGTVSLAGLAAPRARWTVQLGAAATALAFALDGQRLAVGDAAGGVRLLQGADGSSAGPARSVLPPIRWLDFGNDGSVLLLANDGWLHALATSSPALEPVHSRFAPRRTWGSALAAGPGAQVRLVGWDARGVLGAASLDLAALPDVDATHAAPQTERNWPAVLALRLDDDGEPAPFNP